MTSPTFDVSQYDVVWRSPSGSSRDAMPVGGGGSFDENNQMLKLGRIRLRLTPNLFGSAVRFVQRLNLRSSRIEIDVVDRFAGARIEIWVEVDRSAVTSRKLISIMAISPP